MKTNKIKNIVLAIVIILISGSCIEYYTVSTKVNLDGSLTRTIQVLGDSSAIFGGSLKVPTDSALWDISARWTNKVPGDTTTDKLYEYTAVRDFKDVNELNEFLKIESDTTTFTNSHTHFRKKFRWFYTYISFDETYEKDMPFEHSSINNYLTDAEYSYFYDKEYTYVPELDSLVHIKDLDELPILSHVDSVRSEALEEKLMLKLAEWYTHNIFEEYYFIVIEEISQIEEVKKNSLRQNKNEIYKELTPEDMFSYSLKSKKSPMSIIADFIEISQDSIKKLNPSELEEFYFNLDHSNDIILENYTVKHNTELPGLLIDTNADSIAGIKTYWNYNLLRNFAKDYSLYSESRIVNKWAFAVTGFVLLMLLIFIIRGFVKR